MNDLSSLTPKQVCGLDLGDKKSQVCVGSAEGTVLEQAKVNTTADGLARFFQRRAPLRIALETGTQWTELLARAGHPSLAAQRTAANLRICERYRWNDHSALCHRVLGACALAEGRLDDAEAELRRAEPVFHSGHMLFELASLHVTAGSVALARRDAATALHRAAEALALAQPRGMRLVHADALVLRGRARLLEAPGGSLADSLDRALVDAEEALRLARDFGYAWAERDALALQAEAHAALARAQEATGNTAAAARHRDAAHRAGRGAEALAARLRLTEEDLAAADAKAAAWLAEWEKEEARRAALP